MVKGASMLYHSVLSPLLNVGLLDPRKVIDETLKYAKEYEVPLNSLEGFIRQIIGWREFIRLVYEYEGVTLRNANKWKHTRKLPESFWTAHTNIEPIDESISRILDTGYAHHIERLMLHGNFMFLLETDPNDVYTWFMELFIDSYDWVMVPNVYGMTQQSAQGIMTTKPYISGSNYILKMSNYSKGPWCDVWDALYWSFIIKHREELASNGRMHFVTSRAKKLTSAQKKEYETTKETYLKSQQ
jgi:deoxyribodipyrimidine photolyase-related protein